MPPVHPCPACGRHVLGVTASCPHCGASLRTRSPSHTAAALALGLAMTAGCIGDPKTETFTADYGTSWAETDTDVDSDADADTDADADSDADTDPTGTTETGTTETGTTTPTASTGDTSTTTSVDYGTSY